MNGMLKNAKRNCDIMHVAPFAAFAISIFDFIDAEPFGSAFLFFLRHCERSEAIQVFNNISQRRILK